MATIQYKEEKENLTDTTTTAKTRWSSAPDGVSLKRKLFVLVIAWFFWQAGIPHGPKNNPVSTVVFWVKVLGSCMGFYVLNSFPKDSESMSFEPPKRNLVPLPNEINARNTTDLFATVGKYYPEQPVVIRHAVQSHPEIFHDILDYNVTTFEKLYGESEVDVFTHMANVKSAIKMPFTEYTKVMKDRSRKLYARAIPDRHGIISKNVEFDALAKILQMSGWLMKMTKAMGREHGNSVIFVGSNHVWSSAHCDTGSSVFIMMQGRKRWVFYGPSETPYLYPYGQHRNVAFSTGVDVLRPNYDTHPLFAQARGYEVVIEPGDVLVFPSLWWHAVQNLDEATVGVDIPSVDPVGSFHRNAPLTFATFLNPMLWYTTFSSFHSGKNVRDVFFKGYLAEKDGQVKEK